MNRVFDYNGAAVSHSKPVKQLKTVKKTFVVDSGDRDVQKYPDNGDFVVYLPRVYENVVTLRLSGAEFPDVESTKKEGGTVTPLNYILDIEGLNKTDECSVGADRSGYPDGMFAKIPTHSTTAGDPIFYNDHSDPENIGHYKPAIGKLDRMRIRVRLHTQKQSGGYVYWADEFSLTFEVEMLDNVFDDFSSFESRIADRSNA
jgi:hypothetical protein